MKLLNKKNCLCLVLLSGCFLVGCSDSSEEVHLGSQQKQIEESILEPYSNENSYDEVPDVSFEQNTYNEIPEISFEQEELSDIPEITFDDNGEFVYSDSDDKADEYNEALNEYRESVDINKKMSLKNLMTLLAVSNDMRDAVERIEDNK